MWFDSLIGMQTNKNACLFRTTRIICVTNMPNSVASLSLNLKFLIYFFLLLCNSCHFYNYIRIDNIFYLVNTNLARDYFSYHYFFACMSLLGQYTLYRATPQFLSKSNRFYNYSYCGVTFIWTKPLLLIGLKLLFF